MKITPKKFLKQSTKIIEIMELRLCRTVKFFNSNEQRPKTILIIKKINFGFVTA